MQEWCTKVMNTMGAVQKNGPLRKILHFVHFVCRLCLLLGVFFLFGLILFFFFFLNFCDAFCKFSIEILTPGSLETVFLKAMLELLIAKI